MLVKASVNGLVSPGKLPQWKSRHGQGAAVSELAGGVEAGMQVESILPALLGA